MILGKIIILGKIRRQQVRVKKTNARVFQVKPSCLLKYEFMSLCFAFLLWTPSCSLNEAQSIYIVKDN